MKRTILIAGDSATERVVLKGLLKTDYTVLEASCDDTALALLREKAGAVSAVVLDMMASGRGGFAVLKAMKADAAIRHIPVVVTTAPDDEASREAVIACGADSFVTKPYQPATLRRVLQTAIALHEAASTTGTLRRDALTGLLMRASFFQEAQRMIAHRQPGYYVLACFDTENFKIINDQYGTDVGDEVLRHIAVTVSSFVRDIGGLCGRYTADMFAILYPAEHMDSAKIAENHALASSPPCLPRPIRIRIGRYPVSDVNLSVSTMFDRAIMAETQIKGRYDTYIATYSDQMRHSLLREQQVVSDMEDALKNQEFETWFQPQYNHATGALIGAEALVRWRKNGKIVSPNDFIAVFERNGFIYEVDKTIWRQVCGYLRRWLDEGRDPLPVSVNISRFDLYQSDFLDTINGLVSEFALPVDLLRLEITESAFAGSTSVVKEMAGKLIDAGFTVEIDDFGSGYSSLNTLKDVPASILKLDMKFFETTENSERGGNIIESVVRMAKWLGMAVIAEGVESREQADYLKTIGCYYIQGYLYAKPMMLSDYEQEMARRVGEAKLTRLETLETLDRNRFWDPESMETLIFNSYVGGAFIFEYRDGKAEILRVNDQYVSELHGLIPANAGMKEASVLHMISKPDVEKMRRAVRAAAKTGKEAACEVVVSDGQQTEYMRLTVRMIAKTAGRLLFYAVILNMTEQRQAERKQAESAERLRIIMANINGSVSAIQLDENGNSTVIFCNSKYYALFGYTEAEAKAIELDTLSCIIPEDYDATIGKLRQLMLDGVPVTVDYRAKKQDGSLIYVRSISSRMTMDGYSGDIIVSVETDITEQCTLQEQLRAVAGNINGGVSAVYLTADTPEFVLVNDKYFELIGYTREQFFTEVKNPFNLIHPDDRERIIKLVQDSVVDRKTYTMEYRIVRRSGAVRHVLCHTTVMHLFGVKPLVQLAVTSDVTDLRETQRKERDLSLQMQTIMQHLHGGITATIPHSENDVEIVFASEGFYELYGYTKAQMDAEVPNVLDLIVPEDREKTMATVARIVAERSSGTYEYRCRKRDGSLMWTQVTNAVISISGIGDTVLLAIATDVTDLREAQQQTLVLAGRLSTVMDAMNNGLTAMALRHGKPEFLFANRRFYELHGLPDDSWEQEFNDPLHYVHPEDRECLHSLVSGLKDVGQHAEHEYRISRVDGESRWMRVSISVTHLSGVDAPVQVALFRDISDEKIAAEQVRFLNDSAGAILAQPDTALAIQGTLKRLLDYFAAARTYIFERREDTGASDNTYECCADGVDSVIALMQDVPSETTQRWYDVFAQHKAVVTPDVDAPGAVPAEAHAILEQQRVRSLIVVPLCRDGRVIGFVGADNPQRAMDQVEKLLAVSDYLSVLLLRRDLTRKIEHDRDTVQVLMNDTPGGFLRIQLFTDKKPAIVSCNAGFCRMLGMSENEVMATSGVDVFDFLHPEDRDAARQEATAARAAHGQYSCKCRLAKKDGSFLWVMVFGRFVRGEQGETFLNAYFTDITAEKSAEQLQIEMLDSLPTGAGLYEYDGKNLTDIHINKSYWRLIKREKCIGSVIDAIHPDDRTTIHQEIESAISQKRTAESHCRILCGDGSYQAFHVLGSVTPMENGHWLLCLSYAPVSEEALSIQEMLPIALSTMVSSTEDLSYVKDRDLRYICVSHAVAEIAGMENPRDLIGKTALEVFDAAFAEKFEADDRRVLETGITVTNVLEHIPHPNGHIALTRTSKYPILGTDGRAIGVYCVSHDITAQKEKESQLELLTSTIPGGLAAYSLSDGAFKTLFFNDGYYAYSGYSREEYVAMTKAEPLALMLEEDRPKMLAIVRAFAEKKQDGMTQECVYRCHTKYGDIRWMSMKCMLTQVGEEAYTLTAVQFDVTDRMEVDHRRTELLDNLPFGAALFRYDGAHLEPIHVNRRYAEMVGRPVGMGSEVYDPTDYIHPDDRQIVLDEIKDAIADGRGGLCEVRLLYGDGAYRMFRLSANIVPVGDGTFNLFVAYTLLSHQELNFQTMLPHMFATIMASTTDLAFAKDVNFRYTCCSKNFVELLGLHSEKDVIGKTDYDLFPQDAADRFRREDSRLFKTGKAQLDIQGSIPTAQGTILYTNTTKHLLRDDGGAVMGVYCVARDVTEVREAYQQLRLLTDSIPGGIATFRCAPGSVEALYFNDGIVHLFGCSREEYAQNHIQPLDFVFAEDRPIIHKHYEQIRGGQAEADFTFRIHARDGDKYVNAKASLSEKLDEETYIVSAVLTDITAQETERERLRQAEEEYRLAAGHAGCVIGRYNIAKHTMTLSRTSADQYELPECIPDVPFGRVKLGLISQGTAEAYTAFFTALERGEGEQTVTFLKLLGGRWRWIEAHGTPVLSAHGKAVSAIISYKDVTEQREKENAYDRWRHTIANRPQDSYTLFLCNINKGGSYDRWEGKLLPVEFDKEKSSFADCTAQFIDQCVYAEDRERYRAFVDADTMLAEYYRGHRSDTLEFRTLSADGTERWLRLSVDLTESPESGEVEAYLLYEDIDKQKRRELATIAQAETDPLTGVLNRATFARNVNRIITTAAPGAKHALLMLDIDSFKQVNDIYGHGAGDKALTDLASALSRSARKEDLIGRMGGDEFFVFLSNVPDESVAGKKAAQICQAAHTSYGAELETSVSVGIAMYPVDGEGFSALYKSADEALLRVKRGGKNGYAFCHGALMLGSGDSASTEPRQAVRTEGIRRMLIVDDNPVEQTLLAGYFKRDFRIETARDGAVALTKLRHYGTSISVVLLDLMMPGIDGFAVLAAMQRDNALKTVPVIVVSGDDNRETILTAIRGGAADYVAKPVDPDLLRLRVESAISKAENERLRAHNSYLAVRDSETNSYLAALEHSGIMVITMDWGKKEFSYSPSVSRILAGHYEKRSFWSTLLSEMAAESQTVQQMQQAVHTLADDRTRRSGALQVRLKTASGQWRMFDMTILKQVNEFDLASKMVLTLQESSAAK